MAQQQEGAERSHEPTPQKLAEARRKGEIAKSQDVMVAASYLGLLLGIIILGPEIARRALALGGGLLENAEVLGGPLRMGGGGEGQAILGKTLAITLLIILPSAVLVLVGLAAQQAFTAAPMKLAPKLSRISILANAKNKFGPSGLFEFAKSAAKMIVFSGLLLYVLIAEADVIVGAAALAPRMGAALMSQVLVDFLIVAFIASAAIAAIDFAWQRHSHIAKNRMTRQEVLDETKQSEGDPQLKARRRQRAEEIAMNAMLQDVPDASVVVVNPTHYAVALRWSPMDPTPPVCVAKGTDQIAARIREIAAEAGVPIHSDPPTARALHAQVKLGDPIAQAHFAAVATAIRFAEDMRNKARQS